VLADMLPDPVPGLEKAVEDKRAQRGEPDKGLHPVHLSRHLIRHLSHSDMLPLHGGLQIRRLHLPGPGQQPLAAIPVQAEIEQEIPACPQACHLSRVASVQPLIFRNGAAFLIRTPNIASSLRERMAWLFRLAIILLALLGPIPGTLNSCW